MKTNSPVQRFVLPGSYLLGFTILFFLTLTQFFLLAHLPNPLPLDSFSDSEKSKKETIFVNKETYADKIQNAANVAFNSYVSECLDFDEFRPLSNSCSRNYGFHLSIVESLEPMFMLNLSHNYLFAKDFLKKNFKCSTFKNPINRKDLFERGIAALLAIYQLSGDVDFIKIAEKCVNSIIELDTSSYLPKPILSFTGRKGFGRDWEGGTSLLDMVSGIPELISLYKLTNNNKYIKYIQNLMAKLPNNDFMFYFSTNGTNSTSLKRSRDEQSDINTLFIRAYSIFPEKLIYDRISNIIESKYCIKNIRLMASVDSLLCYNSSKFSCLIDENPTFSLEKSVSFDATKLRQFIYNGKENEAVEIIEKSLNLTYKGNGFSEVIYTNKNHQRFVDIQPSSFLGNWINFACHIKKNKKYKSSIFNECGHLIYMK